MSNDQCPSPNRKRRSIGHWSLVIGTWSFIGHWSLVIGHFPTVIGHFSTIPGSLMPPTPPTPDDRSNRLQEWVAEAQHDLRNPLGNILGFCEILAPQFKGAPNQGVRHGLETISQAAEQIAKEVDNVLDPNKTPPAPEAVKALQGQLRQWTSQIISTIQALVAQAGAPGDNALREDLARMADSADRLSRLVETSLSAYPT